MLKVLIISLSLAGLLSCKTKTNNSVQIESNGNLIAYSQCGNADTTLLFVHGWCIDKSYWSEQEKFFCPRYRVVSVDLPGFGQSGKKLDSAWSFGDYTTDVKSVIEKLQLKNVVLIGHSMSGDIILDMSSKYPGSVIGIIGIDNLHQPASPVIPDPSKQRIEDFFALMYSRYDSVIKSTMAVNLFQPSTDSSVRNRVMTSIFATGRDIAVKVLKSNVYFTQQEQANMKALHHKLYLINSDVNPVSADSLNKYCSKGFQAEFVHGTGHYPMLENPAAFNTALQKIMDAISQ